MPFASRDESLLQKPTKKCAKHLTDGAVNMDNDDASHVFEVSRLFYSRPDCYWCVTCLLTNSLLNQIIMTNRFACTVLFNESAMSWSATMITLR